MRDDTIQARGTVHFQNCQLEKVDDRKVRTTRITVLVKETTIGKRATAEIESTPSRTRSKFNS